ncbi:MAG: hypothetical protein WAT81_03080 [Candidatus Moraniibacteriota bacterium]
MNEFLDEQQELAPGLGVVALIAGFLLGIPVALTFGPLVLPMLPGWLNDPSKNIVFSLLAGLSTGGGAALFLMLSEHWSRRH